MKKIKYYLISVLPLLVLLLLQIVGVVLISFRYGLIYGDEFYDVYMDKMAGILVQIQLITLLVTGPWYYLSTVRRRKLSFKKGLSRLSLKSVGIIFCTAIAAQLLIGFLLSVWQYLLPEMIESYSQLMEESGIAELTVASAIATVILAPLGEEIVFRGITMEYLRRAGAPFMVANVLQALFFGIAHMNLVQGVYAFLLGLLLGFLWRRYQTIWASMLLHMFFNAYSTFASPILENLEISDAVYAAGYAVLGSALMVFGMRRLLADTKDMRKRLLVTGASGFLGSRLVRCYEKDYRVLAPGHRELDICNLRQVRAYWKREKPELVVHCAAVSDTGACQAHPTETWRVNVEGTENLARVCEEYGTKFIFCSSDQIYFGSDLGEAHRENEVLEPAGEYGRQKLEAERRSLSVCPGSVCLRLCWMYDTVRLSGQEHGNFMESLLRALRENQELTYPIYDYRGITDVNLVVQNLEKAFSLPGGVYNFGSENACSTYETVYQLLEACGYSTEHLHKNETAFADKPRNIRVCMDKAEAFTIHFPDTLEQLITVLKRENVAK